MSQKNDGSGKQKTKADEKDDEDKGNKDEDENKPTTSSGKPSVRATESAGGKDKKGKTLRFAVPEGAQDEPRRDETRSNNELELQNVVGFRSSPLPYPQPGRVADIMRAMHVDVADQDSGSSIYWETENSVIKSTPYPYKPLFDALRRSPTKSQADYHLLMSAYLRNLDGVVQALENGANVNVIQDQQTPLLIATENNDKPLVKYLLTVHNINLNVQNINGYNALQISLRNGFNDISAMLIKANASLDMVDNWGRTALHEALFRENYKMVQLLILHHHQLEKTDAFGEKPIYTCAVKKPNLTMLNYLLDAGASCEYTNVTGISLLSRAILHSTCIPVIERLISAGADVNHEDYFCKRTPLHMAAIINSVPIAKLLIDNGADPELKTLSGMTAFDLALYYRCFDTAEFLAVYTHNPALSLDNFKDSLLSRLPNHSSALFLLRTNYGQAMVTRRSSYEE